MIEKIVYSSEEEQIEHQKTFGGYNALPPNFKEITAEEFAQSGFFIYGFNIVEYRQPMDAAAKKLKVDSGTSLKLFYLSDGSGFGIGHDYWAKKVRYFTFTRCEHTYRQPTDEDFARGVERPAMCYHVSICTKCGDVHTVDSSG